MNFLPLIVVIVLAHATYTGCRISLSLYALELQGGAFTVGVLMSLLGVIPMLAAVTAGRWTDRVGPATPSLVALLTMATGAVLPWALESIASLYAASVLLGSGFMLVHIAANNAVGHLSTPANRAHNFGILSIGFSISSVLGPISAGLAIDHLGHARAFLCLVLLLAAALLAWPRIRSLTAAQTTRPAPPADARVTDLFRLANLRDIFIIGALLSIGWDLFTFMVPLQGDRIGLSASTIGLIMGAFGAATFVIRVAMPWITRNFSEWQTIRAALCVTTLGYVLFPFFTSVPVLIGLSFLLGLGLGSTQPMVMSLLHMSAPAGRSGEAVGVRTTLMNASHATMPLTFGAIGSAFGGFAPIFWILAAVMGAGTWFAHRHTGSKP
ncbi:MAG: MFS transporter [Burkholderiales bacterium]|nr:MFS transporter [Burkholderiales bacterium]